ncbi:phosphoribosyltransferase [Sphingomonas sp. ZT3P38]|uniref:phosphoribosyltransferase n=1 Tax=Parasphingomonas zepuensis TaxID=3096161 RepID=UPI002FCC10C1
MRLHGLCYYRGNSETWTTKFRKEDWAARNLVKAIKHEDFKGYSDIKTGNSTIRIDNTVSGRNRALNAVAGALANKISQAGYQNAAVIPIPSSSHVNPNAVFTGRRIAEAIRAKNGAFVSTPVLYFDEPLQKSAGGGGTRNAGAIQAHLRLANCQLPPSVVLLDDVCTTGGHLKAAARFLAEHGVEVQDAFVIGRTVWEQPDNMFAVQTEEMQTTSLFDFDF